MAERRSRTKTTSDNKLPDLPPELWTVIIARLPAKTLMRFRCVCKTWCSLIDSSDFIHMHRKIYNNRNQYLLASDGDESTIYSIDTFKKIDALFKIPENCSVLSRCYGLVLIDCYVHSLKDCVIILHNPCIRKSLVIPPSPFTSMEFSHLSYCLGFSPSSNDYKLVAFRYVKYPEFSLAVYSLNDPVWRVNDRLDSHIRGFLSYLRSLEHKLYFKGAMYWLGHDEDKSGPPGTMCKLRTLLVSFDFDSEEFDFVDLPEAAVQSTYKFKFVLGESIAVFSMSSERIYIWVLVKDGVEKSWRIWYTGDSNLYALQFLKRTILTEIFNVEKNIFFVQSIDGLYSYDFISHKMQYLYHYTEGYKWPFETYVESLVLHKRNQGNILTSFPREDD